MSERLRRAAGVSSGGLWRLLLFVALALGTNVVADLRGWELPFLVPSLLAAAAVYGGWGLVWYVRYRLRGRS